MGDPIKKSIFGPAKTRGDGAADFQNVSLGDYAEASSKASDLDTASPDLTVTLHGVDSIFVKDTATVKAPTCYLLEKLSMEIRLKIWEYVVKEDRIITPYQLQPTSNTFSPAPIPEAKFDVPTEEEVMARRPFSAVQLSKTCHQIYDEVSRSNLFYRLNEFEFTEPLNMLTYLVAITSVRANAILSIKFEWFWTSKMRHALTMLAACEGLRNVTIEVNFQSAGNPYRRPHLPYGLCHLCDLRGLEFFKMEEAQLPPNWMVTMDPDMVRNATIFIESVATMEEQLKNIVMQPKALMITRKDLEAANTASNLNIYGEGRLGIDRKPGIIASRTRRQKALGSKINEIGVIPELALRPKFGRFGELLWQITAVTASREINNVEGDQGVEVKVVWKHIFPDTWEHLDRIINKESVNPVVRFFAREPDAFNIGSAMKSVEAFVEKGPAKKWALRMMWGLKNRHVNETAKRSARRLIGLGNIY